VPDTARPRARALVGATVALAIVVAAFIAALLVRRSQRPEGYSDAVYATFMDACSRDGGEPVRPVCQCIWDRSVTEIPYARFKEINAELLAQEAEQGSGVPLHVPDDFGAIVRACADELGRADADPDDRLG
jgi:hypothetical protein